MDRHLAIRNTHKNADIIDGASDAWDLEGNKIIIDEELVKKEMAKLQAEYEKQSYARARASAFPSIQDQLDMIYWDKKNGTKKWEEVIDKVKTDHPKPN